MRQIRAERRVAVPLPIVRTEGIVLPSIAHGGQKLLLSTTIRKKKNKKNKKEAFMYHTKKKLGEKS